MPEVFLDWFPLGNTVEAGVVPTTEVKYPPIPHN